MEVLKLFLKQFGYTIRRIDTPMRTLERGLEVLPRFIQPHGVIDIGVGEGTPALYKAFPLDRLPYLLVEADPYFRDSLQEFARTSGAKIEFSFCGKESGTVELHTGENHHRSSLFTPEKWSLSNKVSVPVERLDTIVGKNTFPSENLLIKIDTEGAEMDVLSGAGNVLRSASAVILETSVRPRYKEEEGKDPFGEIVSFMHDKGFRVFDILSGSNRRDMLAQVDLVFVPITLRL